jgi:hypothetical protein
MSTPSATDADTAVETALQPSRLTLADGGDEPIGDEEAEQLTPADRGRCLPTLRSHVPQSGGYRLRHRESQSAGVAWVLPPWHTMCTENGFVSRRR